MSTFTELDRQNFMEDSSWRRMRNIAKAIDKLGKKKNKRKEATHAQTSRIRLSGKRRKRSSHK